MAGALIVVGMYQAFFSQSYAVKLTALSLSAWPESILPLMHTSLYRRAEREAFKQQFPEKQDELLIAKEDLSAPYPRWNNLDLFNEQSLKKEITSSFNIAAENLPERLLLLVAGAGTLMPRTLYRFKFNITPVFIICILQTRPFLAPIELIYPSLVIVIGLLHFESCDKKDQ